MASFPPEGSGLNTGTTRTESITALPKTVTTGSSLRAQSGYDPTGATASDAALQNALNAAASYPWQAKVIIPQGDICKLATGAVTIPAGVELVVDGLLDCRSLPFGAYALQAIGSASGPVLTLVANCPAGQQWCQVGAGAAPTDGSYCLLSSTALWNTGLPAVPPATVSNQMIGEYLVVRVPSATVNTLVGSGDSTIVLNNTQGDSRQSYFWPGCPVQIDSEQITFTGVSVSSTTITFTGCTRGANGTSAASHSVGATVTLPSGYVAFARGCYASVGGAYNTADTATLQACTFIDGVALTGSGKLLGPGGNNTNVALYLDRCRRVRCSSDLLLEGFSQSGISMFDVLESTVNAPNVYGDRSSTSTFYGVSLWCACQDVTIVGGNFRDVRHGISFVSESSRPGITRRCGGVGSHAEYTTATGFDFHMACEEVFMDDFTAFDCQDQGLQFRCPSGRARGIVKRSGAYGVWCQNQSTQPNDYDIDVTVEDPGGYGIYVQPSVGFSATLQTTMTNATTGSITVTTTTAGGTVAGYPASGYLAFFDTGEIVHYSSLTSTTFVVDARAQLGTTATSHSIGTAIMLANTGTGASTHRIRIRGQVLRATASQSVQVWSPDAIRFPMVDIDVAVKDQTYANAGVRVYYCDYSSIRAKVYNHPLANKGVELISCTASEVRGSVYYNGTGTNAGISLEGCTQVQVLDPIAPNARFGVSTDAATTNCAVIHGTGLIGATTPLSFAGTGNIALTAGMTGTPTYGTTVTPALTAGSWQTVTATNTTAFTIAAPTSPPNAAQTAELTIEVLNSSGGVLGAITWNAAFVFAGFTWTNPANTKKRFARFEWNGASWICTSVATADY